MIAHIVNTSDGRDAYELIKSGIMGKMSFGFNVRHANMDYSYANAHQYPLRKVDSLDLMEVSAVRFPAYLDTNIEARSSQEVFAELEKRGFNVSNVEFDTRENGEDNLNMNFEEIKSDEIRSLIEHGKQELEKRESSESKVDPQEKAVSSSPIIVKLDEEVMSQLSEIRSALTQLVPKKEHRDDEDDLDTDADKQAKEKQKDAEKPEEKPAEKPVEGDKKEEDRACGDKKEDRECGSEGDKKEEERAKCDPEDKRDDDEPEEDRSLPPVPPQQPPMDEHRQEINSVIDSLKELFR